MTAPEKPDFTESVNQSGEPHFHGTPNSIALTEQQAALAQMHPLSSTAWLDGFAITEGSGVALGAVAGGGLGYAVGSHFGTGAAFLLNAMGRGQTVLPFSEVSTIARLASLRGAGYGALAGPVAGVGYGLYKGYEYLEPKITQT